METVNDETIFRGRLDSLAYCRCCGIPLCAIYDLNLIWYCYFCKIEMQIKDEENGRKKRLRQVY